MADAHRENRRLWNEWSDAFQALWNAETGDGDLPPVPSPFSSDGDGWDPTEVIPSVEGASVVELGCGGGQGTVGTALAGADRVVGVDISDEQLRHARRLRDYYDVEVGFVHGDVTHVPLPDDEFEVAFSEWAFQMVADLGAALEEARRVLGPEGVFLLSVPHPVHELFDPESSMLERSYHAAPRRIIDIDESYDAEMVTFDRRIGEYHHELREAGFRVDRILEPDPRGDDAADVSDDDLAAFVPRDLRFVASVE